MGHRTMKKKVVYRLPITTTHTNTYQPKSNPYQIIQSEGPTMCSNPQRECHVLRNLWFPNPLPRKQRIRSILDCKVVRTECHSSSFLTLNPPQLKHRQISNLIFPTSHFIQTLNICLVEPILHEHKYEYKSTTIFKKQGYDTMGVRQLIN